jgi:hypothetical protein
MYYAMTGYLAGYDTAPGDVSRRCAYIHRSAEIADILDAEFAGPDAARLVKVIGSRIIPGGSTAETSSLIADIASPTCNPTSAQFDAIAINPYFSGSGATVDAILDGAEAWITNMTATVGTLRSMANAAGLDLFAYEGGPLMTSMTSPYPEAHDDPRMKELVEQLHDMWFAQGGKEAAMGFLVRDSQNGGARRELLSPPLPRYLGYHSAAEAH